MIASAALHIVLGLIALTLLSAGSVTLVIVVVGAGMRIWPRISRLHDPIRLVGSAIGPLVMAAWVLLVCWAMGDAVLHWLGR